MSPATHRDASTYDDAELIVRARADEPAAVAQLYARHQEAAHRLARRLTDNVTAEDLTSDAFTKVFAILREGKGPDLAFRPYLLATVRNTWVNHVRTDSRYVWVDDYTTMPEQPSVGDGADGRMESAVLSRAFNSLPERWQLVLWHTSVEGESLPAVGKRLGLAPNAVAALSYRAREGLRQAYLTEHLATTDDENCREVRAQLPAYIRGQLGKRQKAKVDEHLDTCRGCAAALLDLEAIGSKLGAILVPALLGVAATSYGVTGASGGAGLLSLLGRLRPRGTGAIAGTTAASVTAIALVVAAAVTFANNDRDTDVASPPSSQSPAAPPSDDAPPRTEPDLDREPPMTDDEVVRVATVVAQPPPASTTPPPVDEPPVVSPTPPPTPAPTDPDPVDPPPVDPDPVDPPPVDPDPEEPVEPEPDPETTYDLAVSPGLSYRDGDLEHVELAIESQAPEVTLTIEIPGLERHAVHGAPWAPMTCTTAATTLTCTVSNLEGSNGAVGFDVWVSGDFSLTATIQAADNDDPNLDNNTVTLPAGPAPALVSRQATAHEPAAF